MVVLEKSHGPVEMAKCDAARESWAKTFPLVEKFPQQIIAVLACNSDFTYQLKLILEGKNF